MEELKSEYTPLESVMAVTQLWANIRSKDPSTKVGACVYDQKSGGLFLGYNGFPSGIPDLRETWENRSPASGVTKYDLVVHAEVNAVRKALVAGADMSCCLLVITHLPCAQCMKDVIGPSGIKRVFYDKEDYVSRNEHSTMVTKYIAEKLGVTIERVGKTV